MTSYDEIYNRFLGKIDDYNIFQLLEDDTIDEDINGKDFVKSMLLDYLNSGISLYTYQTQDLSLRDDETETFQILLTDTEQDILSSFMVVSYLTPKVIRSDMIEHRLSSKDLQEFSPANLMKEIRTIRKEVLDHAKALMTENYIRAGH